MGQISQIFQPPLLWQQFEDLTQGVFREVFGDPSPSKSGRQGQPQQGVDVYGYHVRTKILIGVQCKQLDQRDANNRLLPGCAITEKMLNEEYNKALGFSPKLNLWILATTAKRDGKIQNQVRMLNDRSLKEGNFGVQLWCWEDFITFLNSYDDLQRQYYSTILSFQSHADQDRVILDLYAMAFSRPAFQVSMSFERPEEFMDAISDTKRAMNTGELRDRKTGEIIRKVLGGRRYIETIAWRKACNEVYLILDKINQEFMTGQANGKIYHSGTTLIIDPQLERTLEGYRVQCLAKMNLLFTSAGLPTI